MVRLELLVLLAVAASCAALMQPEEATPKDRMVLISSVVERVKQKQEERVKAAAQMKKKRPITMLFIKDDKILKPGRARTNYESAVRDAEAQILKLLYKDALDGDDMEAKAEALARAAFHKPGTVLTKEELTHIQSELEASCVDPIRQPDCSEAAASTFRTFDGTCNNVDNPLWGAAFTPVGRLLPAQYEDGVQQPRGYFQARDKDLLHRDAFDAPNPSARQVVGKVHPDRDIDDPLHTHMMMQWGQFLDHDFALSPEFGEEDCPQPDCEFTERCIPILIPNRDPVFDSSESSCLFFPRSVPVCDTVGTFTARNQLNVLTSYIDASMVYGSTKEQSDNLRSFEGGRLLTGPQAFAGSKPSLPLLKDPPNTSCPPQIKDRMCFVGGDPRPNEQISLAIMHTIWMREHNRVADKLSEVNPQWNDQTLYQTSRKILGAELQAVVYEEYLYELLGRELFDLLVGQYQGYDSTVDATLPTSFSAAVFRYGHSQIRTEFERLDEEGKPLDIGPLDLVKAFFNPASFNESLGTDPIIRGLLVTPGRQVDEFMNPTLTSRLFESPESLTRDLISLNLQRGRDHGLPAYPVWRDFCQNYLEEREVPLEVREVRFRNALTQLNLLKVYGSFDSVDLFTGMLAEDRVIMPNSEAILGPTMACLFAITFNRLRMGDRYFYENPGVFTRPQQLELRGASLAKVLCDNADNIPRIQKDAFKLPASFNPVVPCEALPSPDLEQWRDDVPLCWPRFVTTNPPAGYSLRTSWRVDGASGREEVLLLPKPGEQDVQCWEMACPDVSSRVVVVPGRPGCRMVPNPALPDSIHRRPDLYEADWQAAQMTPEHGVYESGAACRAASVSAVTWECPDEFNDRPTVGPSINEQDDDLVENLEKALGGIK
nr:peroxidase-like protein 3 [Halisarca dujardinii]